MKIKHYLYNAFIIESGKIKIAIDPGLNLSIWKLGSLIPKSEWPEVTHILATHGDPDHYWYTDKMAEVANAPVICGKDLVKNEGQEAFILGPRSRGVQYSTRIDKLYPLDVGDVIDVDGVRIEGLKAVHGPLQIRFFFGLANITETPGPGERVGLGAIGFKVNVEGKTAVNLGDTLFQEEWKEWKGMEPDVLMLPIGGRVIPNTIDEKEALEVVKLMSPKMVIPCHYNNDILWIKNANPADGEMFKREVEKIGLACTIMKHGDAIIV
jgi:L-ascorbate metabolism protein UlaG (beta-lactamase superfamily)